MRRRIGLRWKIAALCGALATAAIAILTLFSVVLPWRDKARRQERAAVELVNLMAPQIIRLLPGDRVGVDAYQLEQMLRSSMDRAQGRILFALVLDKSGVIDAQSSRVAPSLLATMSTQQEAAFRGDPGAFFENVARGKVWKARRVRVGLRVPERPEILGHLELGISTATIDEELRAGLLRDGAILLAVLAFAFFGSLAIGNHLARPLNALSQAMGRLREGDFEVRSDATRRRDEVGDLAAAFNEMARGLKERERLRGTLGRYVSGDVAERILEAPDDLSLPGELRKVTVMFLDVRGFTTVSERLQPREVVSLLNAYFDVIVDRVTANGGTVNKFIGDAAMCIWGAPREVATPERNAVICALEIQRGVQTLTAARSAQGEATVGIGIGINSGEVVAGNLGAARRLEYTVIGDAVNLAQRLESQAQRGEVLVSEPVFVAVAPLVDALAREPVKLKGKSQPVPLWEIKGLKAATEAA